MQISLVYKLQKEEIEEFMDNHLKACAPHNKNANRAIRNGRAGRLAVAIVMIILGLPFLLLVTGIIPPAGPKSGKPANYYVLQAALLACAPIVIVILFSLISRYGTKRNCRKLAAAAETNTVQIDAENITFSSPTITVTVTWHHFAFWYQTEHLVLLCTAECAPRVIPKRAFPDASTLAEFLQLCGQEIDKVRNAFPVSVIVPPPVVNQNASQTK